MRVGDNVALFPYEHGTQNEGEAITFDTTDDHTVANALARQALLRSFLITTAEFQVYAPSRS